MNKVYLLYRYDEYGEKQYLRHSNLFPFATFCCSEIDQFVESLGGGWDNGWIIETFYNPIQD